MKLRKALSVSFTLSLVFANSVFASNIGIVSEDTEVFDNNNEVVEFLEKGQKVEISGLKLNNYMIESNNESYVKAKDLYIEMAEGTVKGDQVNLRKNPTTSSKVLGVYSDNDKINVLNIVEGSEWYQVEYNSEVGYVSADYVEGDLINLLPEIGLEEIPIDEVEDVDDIHAVITSSTGLRLREDSSEDAGILDVIPSGDAVDVKSVDGEWLKVSYNNVDGYISSDFAELKEGSAPEKSSSSKGVELVSYAKNFIGTRYSWGGTNLSSGVDCSGFTTAIYRDFGITLNRTSRDQYNNGVRVSKNQLVEGDLVFFDTSGANNGSISHVGIYIGNGQFIHSSTSRGVIISDINTGYYNGAYVGGTRILG